MTAGRVDAHHHLWDLRRRAYPWMDPGWAIARTFTTDDLRVAATPHCITHTVAVQAVHDVDETHELLAVAATPASDGPAVAGVVGWVDLASPEVGDTLAALREGPGGQALVGIRHQVHDEDDPEWLLRDEVARGLRALAGQGLVYDLLIRERELPAARRTVAALPELAFVVDHLAKPRIAAGALDPWQEEIAALARYDNVFCKVSGMVTEASWDSWTVGELRPYVDHVLEVFGPERLVFGSDWPVCLLAAPYDQVVEAAEQTLAGLSADERQAVFGATARRVYRLP